jgi:hypothetical protein
MKICQKVQTKVEGMDVQTTWWSHLRVFSYHKKKKWGWKQFPGNGFSAEIIVKIQSLPLQTILNFDAEACSQNTVTHSHQMILHSSCSSYHPQSSPHLIQVVWQSPVQSSAAWRMYLQPLLLPAMQTEVQLINTVILEMCALWFLWLNLVVNREARHKDI